MAMTKKIIIIFLIVIMYLPASAEDNPDSFCNRNYIFGNWKKSRIALEEAGILLELVYKGEFWGVASGNVPKGTAYDDNIDIVLSLDFGSLMGWDGASFTFYGLGNNGSDINEYVGSAMGVTNIAAPNAWKLYNIYLEQLLLDGHLSLLFGLYDYNSEFDVKETASLFISPTFGIGHDIAQSGENGPSIFPTASLGLRVKAIPFDHTYVQAVVLDGVPGDPNNPKGAEIILKKTDGLLISGEAGYITGDDEDSGERYSKSSIGFWYYTDNYDHFVTGIKNYGFYTLFEQSIYHEEDDPAQNLAFFSRLGVAYDVVNDFDYYIGGGLVYTGLIPGRDEDKLGLAFATSHSSFPFREQKILDGVHNEPFETDIELTYRLQITPAIALQPDVQFFFSPAYLDKSERVIAAGTRLELNF